jgi:hypothetical protein
MFDSCLSGTPQMPILFSRDTYFHVTKAGLPLSWLTLIDVKHIARMEGGARPVQAFAG